MEVRIFLLGLFIEICVGSHLQQDKWPPTPTWAQPSEGSKARKFLQQIQPITLQLNRQTQHSVPTKKVPSERKQPCAGPAGEKRVNEGIESSHPSVVSVIPVLPLLLGGLFFIPLLLMVQLLSVSS